MMKKILAVRATSLISKAVAVIAFAGATQLKADAEFQSLREETFQAVWDQVNANYYDASFGGRDWAVIGERYRARLPEATDRRSLRGLVSEMLFELGESHIGILSSHYDLAEHEAGWGGGWSGLDLCYAGDRLALYRIDRNGPAYASGLRDGDVLLAIDGESVEKMAVQVAESGLPEHLVDFSVLQLALSRLRGVPGSSVEVEVEKPAGERERVEFEFDRYEGRMTQRLGNLGAMPLTLERRTFESGLAYLQFNLWFPAAMQDIRAMVTELPADTPGLIIDLRGNVGGVGLMASGLAGLLLEEQTKLGTTTLREGHINFVGFPQKNAFLGPVAVMVDEASCSTSEVFAIGLQEAGRIKVFGQPTPGAALPSVVTELPNGDFLQLALGDFKTPSGKSLEGVGVQPDTLVEISPVDLSQGRDTVLEAARSWILNSH